MTARYAEEKPDWFDRALAVIAWTVAALIWLGLIMAWGIWGLLFGWLLAWPLAMLVIWVGLYLIPVAIVVGGVGVLIWCANTLQ